MARYRAADSFPGGSGFVALGHMRRPGLAGFRLDVGEASARRRIGDADEMIAGRTLDLSAGMARVALQRLIAMGTVEFEFVRAHKLLSHHAPTGSIKYMKNLFILFVRRMRM
jgi:hypothetical protein